jgi:hypothetical protein
LKFVDRASRNWAAIKSLEYPGKSCFLVRKDQEDFVLPKEPSNDQNAVETTLISSTGR